MAADDTAIRSRELLARWVRDHGVAVRGYLLGTTGRHDVADDLLQDVLERAWRAMSRYQDIGQERAFLLKIADRLVIDRSRRLGLEINLDDASWCEVEPTTQTYAPLDNLAGAETTEELTSALAQLTTNQRRVLLLRFFSDMTFEEIAETMSCPLSTALSHCRRGLIAMRKLLTGSGVFGQ